LNGVLGQIGLGSDAVPRQEKELSANDLPTRRMGVAGSMVVLVAAKTD